MAKEEIDKFVEDVMKKHMMSFRPPQMDPAEAERLIGRLFDEPVKPMAGLVKRHNRG